MKTPSHPNGHQLALAFTGSLVVAVLLAGCASLPKNVDRVPTQAFVDTSETALWRAATADLPKAYLSGFRLLPAGNVAYDARLTLTTRAQRSLDLQYYWIADDPPTRTLFAALRAAAARGVRVRLLLDDLSAAEHDEGLAHFASLANVQLRVFNPFVSGRANLITRTLFSMGDVARLNRRMHNKIFIADNALAVVGGRNLTAAYFSDDTDMNYVDLDVLVGGATVRKISYVFDQYWNSKLAYPIEALVKVRTVVKPQPQSTQAATRSADVPGPDQLAAQANAPDLPVRLPANNEAAKPASTTVEARTDATNLSAPLPANIEAPRSQSNLAVTKASDAPGPDQLAAQAKAADLTVPLPTHTEVSKSASAGVAARTNSTNMAAPSPANSQTPQPASTKLVDAGPRDPNAPKDKTVDPFVPVPAVPVRKFSIQRLELIQAPGRVLADNPDKATEAATIEDDPIVYDDVLTILRGAKHEISIISPYFIPPDDATAVFRELRKRNVTIRVLTNSLASTDMPPAYAAYAKHRLELLRMGVQFYELRPTPGQTKGPAKNTLKSSLSTLHAKAMVVDRRILFVGSMNLDARSKATNTEDGLIIVSSELGALLERIFDNGASAENSYAVHLGRDGETLQWLTQQPGGETTYSFPPEVGLWRRIVNPLLNITVPDDML